MRAGCSLRFIADESLDGRIIELLRADGYAVVSIAELKPGIEDVDVPCLEYACPVL